jgi:hypothetical protein
LRPFAASLPDGILLLGIWDGVLGDLETNVENLPWTDPWLRALETRRACAGA